MDATLHDFTEEGKVILSSWFLFLRVLSLDLLFSRVGGAFGCGCGCKRRDWGEVIYWGGRRCWGTWSGVMAMRMGGLCARWLKV